MERKAIFDAVRRMLGRGFRADEVAALDAAIDRAEAGPLPPRELSEAGIALIKRFEGCAKECGDGTFEAYPDPGSSLSRTGAGSGEPWTIGWGATGPGIGPGTVWSRTQCDARLAEDLARHAAEVDAALGDAPTSPAQFDALVSFHYNTGAIRKASLTRLHRAGQFAAARAEFGKWVFAGGRRLPGLVRRRQAEAARYGET